MHLKFLKFSGALTEDYGKSSHMSPLLESFLKTLLKQAIYHNCILTEMSLRLRSMVCLTGFMRFNSDCNTQ